MNNILWYFQTMAFLSFKGFNKNSLKLFFKFFEKSIIIKQLDYIFKSRFEEESINVKLIRGL